MKNRRFSSPFISFYEIVIIPTSGSFPSLWITVIPSAFPWSSTLFLDLPDCGSALIFPITSRFPLRTMSKTQHAALQLKLCQCWRQRKEHFGYPEGKHAQNREKTFLWQCAQGGEESHGHGQIHKNYLKKENIKCKYVHKRVNKICLAAAPCPLCHT